jgi:hypothetical protein
MTILPSHHEPAAAAAAMRRFSIDGARLASLQSAAAVANGAARQRDEDLNAAAEQHHRCVHALEAARTALRRSRHREDPDRIAAVEAAEQALEAAVRELEQSRREAEAAAEFRGVARRLAECCQQYVEARL